MAQAKQKRHSYDAAFKLRVVAYAEAINNNNATGRHFGIPERTVRDWRKQKKVLKQLPRTKKAIRGLRPSNPELEKVLADWIIKSQESGVYVTKREICSRAVALLSESTSARTISASESWCMRFLSRHGLRLRNRNKVGRKPLETTEEKFDLKLENYDLPQINNMCKSVVMKRRSYDAAFKLKAVAYAEAINNNNATGRHFGIPEKFVREWRKQKKVLEQMPKTRKARRGLKPSNPELEKVLADWIIKSQENGINLTRDEIRSRAAILLNKSTSTKGSADSAIRASNGWCTRFLLRHSLKLKRKKRKQPMTVEEKFDLKAHNYNLSQISDMYEALTTLLENHSVDAAGTGITDLLEAAPVKQELSMDEFNFIDDAESSFVVRPYGCAICNEMIIKKEEFRKHCYNHGRTPPHKIFADMLTA